MLEDGKPARHTKRDADEQKAFEMLQLLTALPVLYVCNVDEGDAAKGNEHSRKVEARAKAESAACVVICAQMEAEIRRARRRRASRIPRKPSASKSLASPSSSTPATICSGLQTYFTVGPEEARAWTIHKGWTAPQAAGVIHGDFEKGFIRAETISYDDFVANNGEVRRQGSRQDAA